MAICPKIMVKQVCLLGPRNRTNPHKLAHDRIRELLRCTPDLLPSGRNARSAPPPIHPVTVAPGLWIYLREGYSGRPEIGVWQFFFVRPSNDSVDVTDLYRQNSGMRIPGKHVVQGCNDYPHRVGIDARHTEAIQVAMLVRICGASEGEPWGFPERGPTDGERRHRKPR